MRIWRRATVVALLFALWAFATWDARIERAGGLWFEPHEAVTLYFGAPDAQGVAPEVRWLPASRTSLANRLEALISGPEDPDLIAAIPRQTRILSVRREGDLVVVDFGPEIVAHHPGGSAGELITVYAVTNTLTEVAGVERVAWRIDGRPIETLVGHVDLTRPTRRDESIIFK